jgi:hypothetical protein
MPNAIVRANAHAMPIDRRLFLAAGSAAAVFGALHVAAASLVDSLIAAHRSAWRAYREICTSEDELEIFDPEYPAVHAEWKRRSDVEMAAMLALCAFRPATLQEVHQRGDYLADFLDVEQMGREQALTLLRSFKSQGAV